MRVSVSTKRFTLYRLFCSGVSLQHTTCTRKQGRGGEKGCETDHHLVTFRTSLRLSCETNYFPIDTPRLNKAFISHRFFETQCFNFVSIHFIEGPEAGVVQPSDVRNEGRKDDGNTCTSLSGRCCALMVFMRRRMNWFTINDISFCRTSAFKGQGKRE